MAESVSERPTFSEAFASESPATESLPVNTPTTETPAPDLAAAATEQPEAAPVVGDTPAEGPVPYARFKEINESKKQLEDSLSRLKWAESVDRSGVEQMQRLSQFYQQDRGGFINQILTEALSDPQLAPVVRSHAARVLGTRQQTAPAEAAIEPDIPVMDETGRVVAQAFSADRVKALVERGIRDALAREVGPLKQTVQSVEAERQTRAVTAQADQAATAQYQQAQHWPHFTTHEADIAKAFTEHPEWSLQDAYIATVVPKLQAQEQTKTLDDLKTKAAARTVNPSGAVVTSTSRPRSLTDPSLTW